MLDFQEYKNVLDVWARSQAPVFIVGPERSGTSLLFQQVSNHGSFCDFTHATVETFVFLKPWLLLKEASASNYEMRVYLGQKNFSGLKERVRPILKRNLELDGQRYPYDYVNCKNRVEVFYERRYRALLRAFFKLSSDNLNGKRLVEKTPSHIRCVEEIFKVFPNAKVLICTREPAEIIASHRKRKKKELDLGKKIDDPSLVWLSHTTDQYIKYFLNLDKKISHLVKNSPEAVMVVPYGDLTSNFVSVYARILSFLGEPVLDYKSADKTRIYQEWDPLLNSPPQRNMVDLTKYLGEEDLELIADSRSKFPAYWR